ncbi:phosphotransferase [Mycobacterium sp. M26]|uniref:phosphotransferase n=1 Tax=Mycobacterium sp. M26 TaxID=1762962 RepID=UPI000B1D04E8|nr:phosphotransferase [Mycobacterium sp. M26]
MARYSELTLVEAKELLEPFAVAPDSITPLSGGAANSSFVVHDAERDYVLTLLDNHDFESAIALASTIEYAARNGLAVDRLISTREGARVSMTKSGVPVLVKEFFRGHDLCNPTASQIHSIGATLAKVHQVSPPSFLHIGTRRLPDDRWSLIGRAPEVVGLRRLMTRADAIVNNDTWRSLPTGFCHGDLFGDNLLETNEGLILLDWETASVEPFILDVGIACVAYIEGYPDRMSLTVRELVNGYQSVRSLQRSEMAMLQDATLYGLAMLAFHRFVRHNVRHPDPAKKDSYRSLVDLAQRLDSADCFRELE